MQFTDMFPERTAPPPQLPGQPRLKESVLHQLRLPQLRDLAQAYGIEVKKDGTKEELLPPMIDAEMQGVFQQQPKRPEYVAKASRSPDDPPVDWESQKPDYGMSFRHLQQLAKEHGVNSFGKGEEALREELEAKGVL